MILSSSISVTKSQLKLISILIHSPIAIRKDVDKKPVFVVSRQVRLKDRYILKAKLISLIVYSVFILCNGLWHLQSPTLRMEEKALVALFSFAVPGTALASITAWYQNPADVATLLNMILTYEKRVFNSVDKNRDKIQGYGRFLKCAIRLLGLCGSVFIQIFGVLVVIVRVGRPPFLGSIIPGNSSRLF